jgi:hypothetical protein
LAQATTGACCSTAHAGCTAEDIVAALGLRMSDLFPPRPEGAKGTGERKGKERTETHRYPAYDAATGKHAGTHLRIDTWDAAGDRLPKRMHWEPLGVKMAPLALYNVAAVNRVRANGGKLTVIVLEGERKCDELSAALAKAGRLDMIAVASMTGAKVTPCDAALGALAGCDMVLWPDNDDDGRRHMQRIGARLDALDTTGWRWLDWPDAPEKGDAADYLATGGTVASLDALIRSQARTGSTGSTGAGADWRPTVQSLRDIMGKELPPVRWAVHGLFPEGVTLLAGKPKKGKSTLMHHVSVSVAGGTKALGYFDTERGDALYLALEDNERRSQKHTRQMMGDETVPDGVYIAYTWASLDRGGVEALESWLDEHPTTRLVVIDTLEDIRPKRRNPNGGYSDDYASVRDLQQMAGRRQVAIVAVTHLRKAPADDPFDEINATLGLLASVDNALVMRSTPSGATELHRRGRDYEDDSALALRSDREHLTWAYAGSAEEAQRSRERAAILEALTDAVPECLRSQDIAAATKMQDGNVRYLLTKMLADGSVIRPECSAP